MAELVRIDCRRITDGASFHREFAAAFGFPAFYGANGNAWIDCMTRLDEDFSRVRVRPGEIVTVQLDDAGSLKRRQPELLAAVFEMAAFVNWRRLETGAPAILSVSANP